MDKNSQLKADSRNIAIYARSTQNMNEISQIYITMKKKLMILRVGLISYSVCVQVFKSTTICKTIYFARCLFEWMRMNIGLYLNKKKNSKEKSLWYFWQSFKTFWFVKQAKSYFYLSNFLKCNTLSKNKFKSYIHSYSTLKIETTTLSSNYRIPFESWK